MGWVHTIANWIWISLHPIHMTGVCEQLSMEPVHTLSRAATERTAEESSESLAAFEVWIQQKKKFRPENRDALDPPLLWPAATQWDEMHVRSGGELQIRCTCQWFLNEVYKFLKSLPWLPTIWGAQSTTLTPMYMLHILNRGAEKLTRTVSVNVPFKVLISWLQCFKSQKWIMHTASSPQSWMLKQVLCHWSHMSISEKVQSIALNPSVQFHILS